MLNVNSFYEVLRDNNINFFCGVPDSLLKDICAKFTDALDRSQHVITANEGGAISLAAGSYLARKEIPLVYMQNSGLGNAVNPLTSLCHSDVYSIPMLLLVGWRGEPGLKDEPQHIVKGQITLNLLKEMKIEYIILDSEDNKARTQINEAVKLAEVNNAPVAIVVKKNTFEKYSLQNKAKDMSEYSREKAIECIINNTDPKKSLYFGNTGKISRELYESRLEKPSSTSVDFLNVGAMGHVSQIALGVSLFTNKKVYCLDGDGSLLMHLGGLTTIGDLAKENFVHIVLNNGAHDSVGGQPTIASSIDFERISLASGYKSYYKVKNEIELINCLREINHGPTLIEIIVKKGARSDLGRPKETPKQNKIEFMKSIN